MTGNGFVKLRISGYGLNLEEITEKLRIKPTFSCRAGEEYTFKSGDNKVATYKEDCWIAETEKRQKETLDQTIERFMLEFQISSEYIKELSNKFDVTLWISAYPDEEQSNIHLSKDTLKVINDMGISLDFNVLFLKDFYDGTYLN